MIKENADKLKIVYTPLHGTGKMLYDRAFRRGGFSNVVPVPSQAIVDPESQLARSLTRNSVTSSTQAWNWPTKSALT